MSGIILSASVRQNLMAIAYTVPMVLMSGAVLAQDSSGTTVHGGQVLADIVAWGATAFGAALAAFVTRMVYAFAQKIGVEVTQQQRDMLQGIVLNGINDAAAKAKAGLAANASLDINVQRKVVADAVAYTQAHAKDTITALGLDPESGQAVSAIRARIATAIVDPDQHTDPAVTPAAVYQK